MRNIYGEYRGPTGVASGISNKTEGLEKIRSAVDAVSDKLGERLKFLIGKPGLDGHSNGAEQIARWARSRDGREVLMCAGIDPNERCVKGMIEFVKKGVRTSVALSREESDRQAEAA